MDECKLNTETPVSAAIWALELTEKDECGLRQGDRWSKEGTGISIPGPNIPCLCNIERVVHKALHSNSWTHTRSYEEFGNGMGQSNRIAPRPVPRVYYEQRTRYWKSQLMTPSDHLVETYATRNRSA